MLDVYLKTSTHMSWTYAGYSLLSPLKKNTTVYFSYKTTESM